MRREETGDGESEPEVPRGLECMQQDDGARAGAASRTLPSVLYVDDDDAVVGSRGAWRVLVF